MTAQDSSAKNTSANASLQDIAAHADSVDGRKKALRKSMETRRRQAAAILPPAAAGEHLAGHLATLLTDRPAPRAVSGFWPMGTEIDPRPALERLRAAGAVPCLPVVQGRGQPLLFRRWDADVPPVPAGFGTHEPPATAPEVRPDLLLVPLLAFDRRGFRLGYGGGFYDRTLEALRAAGHPALAIGVAYAVQEIDGVPVHGGDQPLDGMVTEAGIVPLHSAMPPGNRTAHDN